jgi:hypothetical protein
MFFEAFAVVAEISFARMLHLTTVVWNAMRLAGVGSERRLHEAIHIVDEHVTTSMESEERSRDVGGYCDEQHVLSRWSRGVGDSGCCDEQHLLSTPPCHCQLLPAIPVPAPNRFMGREAALALRA